MDCGIVADAASVGISIEPDVGLLMLTKEGARLQVFLDLQRTHGLRSGPKEIVIVDERTIERPWGWVFFYTSRGWLDGDGRYAIAGNAPYMVNRFDGSFRFAGTARPVDEWIQAYEVELDRLAKTWELFINEHTNCTLSVAKGIRFSLGLSVVEFGTLKEKLPCVVASGALVDLNPKLHRLVEAGVHAEIRPSDSSICEGC